MRVRPVAGTHERRSWRDQLPWLYRQALIILLVVLFVISLLLPRILVFVEAGEAGVLFRRLAGGVDRDNPPLREGLHLKWPWDEVTIYDLRLQNSTQSHDLVTRDGLQIDTELTIRFRPCYGSLAQLHQEIGPDYLNTLLIPQVGALVRQIAGLCSAEQAYSTERPDIRNAVLQALRLTFARAQPGDGTGAEVNRCAIPGAADADTTVAGASDAAADAQTQAAAATAGEPPDRRALARRREQEALRQVLPGPFADIVVRADAIANDTMSAELLPADVDRDEVCAVALDSVLDTLRRRQRDVPASASADSESADDLVFVQDVLLRSVVLPAGVRAAIEDKVQQEQAMLGYRYRVSQELLESLRKEAEGLGISAFQAATGPGGVSADYLKWQGIAATLGLATSPNAKVVVVGGKDGLPLILNTEGLPALATPPAGAPLAAPAAPPSTAPAQAEPGAPEEDPSAMPPTDAGAASPPP